MELNAYGYALLSMLMPFGLLAIIVGRYVKTKNSLTPLSFIAIPFCIWGILYLLYESDYYHHFYSVVEPFGSVENLMVETEEGWLKRYLFVNFGYVLGFIFFAFFWSIGRLSSKVVKVGDQS